MKAIKKNKKNKEHNMHACYHIVLIITLTSTQLRPSAALLTRFGGLWSQNCLKEGHVLWVDIFFCSLCPSG